CLPIQSAACLTKRFANLFGDRPAGSAARPAGHRLTRPSLGGEGHGLRRRKVSAGAAMDRKVGIAEVATAAGVSISTVSVALNDNVNARVSPSTRERIREAA